MYESFPVNAAAEFYKLTRLVMASDFMPLDIPTLMVVSGDDATVVNGASADFFCEKLTSPDSRLIWHQSSIASEELEPGCEGIELRDLSTESERIISYSHIAITIPRDDPHYGMDGYYPVCLAYEAEPEKLQMCMQDDENTVYAENNYRDEEGFYNGKLVRRTSFNPDFAAMIDDIRCFIDQSC